MKLKTGLVLCTWCNKERQRIPHSNTRVGKDQRSHWKFVDENGEIWGTGKCPDCRKSDQTQRDRKRGIKPYDECDDPRHKKGRLSERFVEKFYKNMGWNVEINKGNGGPDLICTKNGERILVEVKTILKQGPTGKFVVTKVKPNRMKDDFVAMVWNNEYIIIEPMNQHLSKCAPTGDRSITKEYGHIIRNMEKQRTECQISPV